MKTLIGIVTFGNLPFTKLAIRGILETVNSPHVIFGIIGKPDDMETKDYFESIGVGTIRHTENMGFPYSINDIYDVAWGEMFGNDFDNVIIIGNDVVPYPNAIDRMIAVAGATTYEWVCASQFDVRSLCERYPGALPYFDGGDDFRFTNFDSRPWELHTAAGEEEGMNGDAIVDDAITDVRNLCLFKRSVFDKLGFADANFWPGGYFEDNDYFRRARLSDIKACTLRTALYFHFWSRTIKQEGGSTTPKYFERNRSYYKFKWGGGVNEETFDLPFNGAVQGNSEIELPPTLKIANRNFDGRIARSWREKP